MKSWIADGTLFLAILAVVAIEAAGLPFLARWIERRFSLFDVVFQLGAGAALVAALWTMAVGAHWHWTLLWVAVSLPAHLIDLARRLARAPRT